MCFTGTTAANELCVTATPDSFPSIPDNFFATGFIRLNRGRNGRPDFIDSSTNVLYVYSTPFTSDIKLCDNTSLIMEACFRSDRDVNPANVVVMKELLLMDDEGVYKVLNFRNTTVQVLDMSCNDIVSILCCMKFTVRDTSWIYNSSIKYGILFGIRVFTMSANSTNMTSEGCSFGDLDLSNAKTLNYSLCTDMLPPLIRFMIDNGKTIFLFRIHCLSFSHSCNHYILSSY